MTSLLFALTIGATSTFAQIIAEADRFGHGEDSIQCLQNISLYQDHVKTKNFREAYGPWKAVFYKHPAARIDMYSVGADILRALIKEETDPAKRDELVEELFREYIKNNRWV